MNLLILKIAISLIAMIVFLVMALTTPDVINSELFASCAIILGAYSYFNLSNKPNKNHE